MPQGSRDVVNPLSLAPLLSLALALSLARSLLDVLTRWLVRISTHPLLFLRGIVSRETVSPGHHRVCPNTFCGRCILMLAVRASPCGDALLKLLRVSKETDTAFFDSLRIMTEVIGGFPSLKVKRVGSGRWRALLD